MCEGDCEIACVCVSDLCTLLIPSGSMNCFVKLSRLEDFTCLMMGTFFIIKIESQPSYLHFVYRLSVIDIFKVTTLYACLKPLLTRTSLFLIKMCQILYQISLGSSTEQTSLTTLDLASSESMPKSRSKANIVTGLNDKLELEQEFKDFFLLSLCVVLYYSAMLNMVQTRIKKIGDSKVFIFILLGTCYHIAFINYHDITANYHK